jgi:hypothetical protein
LRKVGGREKEGVGCWGREVALIQYLTPSTQYPLHCPLFVNFFSALALSFSTTSFRQLFHSFCGKPCEKVAFSGYKFLTNLDF